MTDSYEACHLLDEQIAQLNKKFGFDCSAEIYEKLLSGEIKCVVSFPKYPKETMSVVDTLLWKKVGFKNFEKVTQQDKQSSFALIQKHFENKSDKIYSSLKDALNSKDSSGIHKDILPHLLSAQDPEFWPNIEEIAKEYKQDLDQDFDEDWDEDLFDYQFPIYLEHESYDDLVKLYNKKAKQHYAPKSKRGPNSKYEQRFHAMRYIARKLWEENDKKLPSAKDPKVLAAEISKWLENNTANLIEDAEQQKIPGLSKDTIKKELVLLTEYELESYLDEIKKMSSNKK